MSNPNDKTAKFYNQVTDYLKPSEVVNQELELINSLTPPAGNILDIGCGSGRHLIPLFQAGYQVTGIDSSKELAAQLLNNLPTGNIIQKNIFHVDFTSTKFDLIILMWNTWNEIALTKTQASKLLDICKNALTAKGKVLINIDDLKHIDPCYLDFRFTNEGIKYDWRVEEYSAKTRTTLSAETIVAEGKKHIAHITQRWWSFEEVKDLAIEASLTIKKTNIKANQELYLVLAPKNGE